MSTTTANERHAAAAVQAEDADGSAFTEAGNEVVLAICGPGALLSELGSLDQGSRSATVTTLEPLEALVVPSAEFSGFLEGATRAPACC